MGIYDAFETDPQAEAEGKWFDYPVNSDGTVPRFRLARTSRTNPRFQAELERVGRKFKTEIKLDILTEGVAFEPMLEVFLNTVLLDWKDVQQKDGTTLPYSKDNAKVLLTKLPALYDDLREKANSLAGFREAEIKANAGN